MYLKKMILNLLKIKSVIIIISIIFYSKYGFAYLGPGLGIGSIMTLLLFIGAIFLMILSFFYYPIKILIKKLFKNKNNKNIQNGDDISN